MYLHKIVGYGSKMSNIIDELLLLSEVRKAEVHTEPLDMNGIVAGAQLRLAHLVEEYGAEIIKPSDWPLAMGYGPWIEEVWVNYLSNAIKYGGDPPRVELGATEIDGKVRFWVRDNGSGVPPEARDRLFTPFTRLDQVRAKGHGLGLSVVQRILDKLSGHVGIEGAGTGGRGSLFYFTLPSLNGQEAVNLEDCPVSEGPLFTEEEVRLETGR